MDIFCNLGYQPVDELVAIAVEAERLGFAGVSLSDHVFVPLEPEQPYPYAADGRAPFPINVPWAEPWVAFAAIGARTSTLRMLTNVFVLPLRHPLHVAKEVATATAIVGPRLMVGVGVGWDPQEFRALGVPFHERGRRTDEAIDMMRAVWERGPSEHHGAAFDLPRAYVEPRPPGPIPILVGGESEAALARAARRGDGYITVPHTVDDLVAITAEVRGRVSSAGRPLDAFHVNGLCPEATERDHLDRLAAGGVSSLRVALWPPSTTERVPLEQKFDDLRAYADRMIQAGAR